MRRARATRLPIDVFLLSLAVILAACASEVTDESTSPEPQTEAYSAPAAASPPADELLLNGVFVEEGVLAGGQPTSDQLDALAAAGYRTVINMRLPDEQGNTQAAAVEELGMTYVTVPVEGAAGLSEERTRAFAEAMAAAEGPVVVHCGSGNRVGALFALKAFYVDGQSVEDSVQLGVDAGMTRLEGAVREHLAAAESAGDS